MSVSLAGLLLVFVGFVYSRAESYQTRRGEKYKHIVRAGLIPFALALACAWFSLDALTGSTPAYNIAMFLLRASMVAAALYAFVVVLIFL